MKYFAFGARDIDKIFADFSVDELDTVPFGVVQVDAKGTIMLYNAAEGSIASFDPKAAIGKNFFTDVAPCTNVPGFRDRFDEGVRGGDLNVLLEWRFDVPTKPLVQVHLKRAAAADRYWVFVKRL